MERVAHEVPSLSKGRRRAGGPCDLVAVLAISLVVALPATATPTHAGMELAGIWSLDRRENLEEFMEKGGASWFKRKFARLASSRVRQIIEVDGIRFKITVETPVKHNTYVYIADDKTKVEAETAAGDLLVWTGRVEGNALILRGSGEIGRREVRREIIAGELVMTVLNLDVDTWFKFYFVRE